MNIYIHNLTQAKNSIAYKNAAKRLTSSTRGGPNAEFYFLFMYHGCDYCYHCPYCFLSLLMAIYSVITVSDKILEGLPL